VRSVRSLTMARVRLPLALAALLALPSSPCAAPADRFGDLAARLTADGFAAGRVERLFASPAAAFDIEGVSLFFVHSEARLDYGQFAAPEAVGRARAYMERHRTALDAAGRDFRVDPAVITGILLVETRLGTFTGERSVFNTLATMAALADETVRRRFWEEIPERLQARRIGPEQFRSKADSKSAWAYRELKAFLTYTAREGIDPFSVGGSYAGAMGYCQFMPTNALTLAVDGDGDGRVDLFDHEDAIASVANYLRHHGWRPELDRKARYRVILRYNYSKYYANTILKIADRLRGAV